MHTKIIESGRHYTTEITTDPEGRTSIVVYNGSRLHEKLIDVELPDKSGKWRNAFKPTVKLDKTTVAVEDITP